MQRLKSLSVLKRLQCSNSYCFYTTSAAQRELNHFQDEVLVEGRAFSRAAILNRPSQLNAITTSMVSLMLQRLYESWEDNSQIGFVTMKGSGRAFSSGADTVTIYRLLQEVTILDGITMGGGACIAIPRMFSIATDKTVFATPEVQMGFHPDSGASFYLSRLPGYLGEFLALTGEKLNGAELVACGLATHYSLNAKLSWIEERLGQLMTDDPSVISDSLAQYGDLITVDRHSVLHKIDRIGKYFCHDTVEEIDEALTEGESHDELCSVSPLSLKITLQSIREGRFQPLDQCLAREYRTSLHCISKEVSGDFCEGIRARLVDKDFAPK
ncbi:3-hydroxyisobutyryl-CoA hydrolase-like protein 2, mitochondrial, partial [Tanacetum coccineum]